MGKKITSSSPLNTIAFNAIPDTWKYANTIGSLPKVASTGSTGSTSSPSGGYYTSTRGNSNLNEEKAGCPLGKHMDVNGICVKNKKKSRGERLKSKIEEDEAMGKTASAARKRKRLAGWELGQEKRTTQIESDKTFFGRLGRNVKDLVLPGYDHDGSGTSLSRSRHEMKVERAKDIKTKGVARRKTATDKADCTAKGREWKWEDGKGCVKKALPNFNPVSTSSRNLSSITTGLIGTGIKKQSQKTCPPGQTYNKTAGLCM